MSVTPARWRERPLDATLAVCFAAFTLGWLTTDLPLTLGFEPPAMAIYAAEIDPYFARMPPHISLIIAIATFVYGPMYIVLLWGLWRRVAWLWKLALPLAGLLFGTNLIYAVAALTSDTPPVDLPLFFALNGPYSLVAVLMIVRFTRQPPPTA